MVHRLILCWLAGATAAFAQLDLTPREETATFEGVKYAQTGFRSGKNTVTYEAPPRWTMQGAGPNLQLRPPDVSMAAAAIEARPLPTDGSLDGTSLTKLQAEIAAGLPREAERVKWEPVEANPVLLNRHETRRLTATYAAFSQSFKVTVVVCNFADQQVRFRLDARESDFEKLYEQLRRSLYTWQGLP